MTKKELNIAEIVGARIKNRDPHAEVILFGSHARGQAHEESDWESLHLHSPLYKNIQKEGIHIA